MLLISTIIILFVFIYNLIYYKNNTFCAEKAMFIWGDSQMCQGLNLKLLKEITSFTPYSAATHGAGVYDFLNFTELVPENSKVLLSISAITIIRKKENERNNSGLQLKNLIELYNCNYSVNEVCVILRNNFNNTDRLFSENNNLYPYSNQIYYNDKISNVKKAFSSPPIYTNDRVKLYVKGLKRLIKKKCVINFILFPVHNEISQVISKSKANCYINSLYSIIHKELNIKKTTFNLEEENQMYDLSHLNIKGANLITKIICPILKKDNCPNMMIFSFK